MERSYLFYAANFESEAHRIEQSVRMGDKRRASVFIDKTLKTIDLLLSAKDISPAGREEWFLVRALTASYIGNDAVTNRILLSYGSPFSQKFIRQNMTASK